MSLEKSDLHRFLSDSIRNGIRRLLHPTHLGGSGTIPGGSHKNSSTSELVKERQKERGGFFTKLLRSDTLQDFFVVVRSFTADSNLLQPTGGVNSTPRTSPFSR